MSPSRTGDFEQRLDVSPAQFRELSHRVVDLAASYLTELDERSIRPESSGAFLTEIFGGPAPEEGLGPAAFDDLTRVAEHSRAGNARFFGYVLGSGEPVGALADLYASVLNQNVTSWRSAPAAVTIERTVLAWLADALGCPGFSGSLTGGGSSANLMALAMARESRAPANETGAQPCSVYASAEAHMSIDKAVALLGIGCHNLCAVPVDADFRMRPDALEAAISADERQGRRPIAVVASAGTVTTGAIDPLPALAEIAKAHDVWLHVDGAYGGLAALALPDRFAGLSEADSLSLDAHKWLFQPLDCGVLLYRDSGVARTTFSRSAAYVRNLSADPIEAFAFFDETLELSRRFRALKLWMSLRYHGFGAFRAAIRENLRQAQLLADLVDGQASLERLAPVELSAVCFRWAASNTDLDRHNAALLEAVNRRGRVYLSNADISGSFALRACITNHRTTDKDVIAVLDEVITVAQELRLA